MSRLLRVYLAGKISKNDWRTQILGGDRPVSTHCSDPVEEWPEVECSIDGMKYLYVGPWFIFCDHGCYHGPGKHGTLDGGHGECGDVEPLAGKVKGHEQVNAARDRAVQLCLRAVKQADLIFAWIDQPGAYGTVFELGYALALEKDVVLGLGSVHEDEVSRPDWWFASWAVRHSWGVDARDAFRKTLETNRIAEKLYTGTCQSPIESKLLEALLKTGMCFRFHWDHWTSGFGGDDGWQLRPQKPAGGYVLDFALEGHGIKIAVECDGHAFHERTKDQAQHDKSRDRWLTENGWRVVRFTGSEIYKDADSCAQQLVRLAHKLTPGKPQAAE